MVGKLRQPREHSSSPNGQVDQCPAPRGIHGQTAVVQEYRRSSALRLIEARKRRLQFIPTSLLGEPAWEILLNLYVREFSGERLAGDDLQEVTGVPLSNALRWLSALAAEKLVSATSDNSCIELTDYGRGAISSYLES